MPVNYWQTSPFQELFVRMADERRGGRTFISDDRRYNTIRGNLTTGAQEVIGKIFDYYHDKDKDDEVNDIIFNAYSSAIGMLPMEPSPTQKVEATKRFWDQIKKGLQDLDDGLVATMTDAEKRAYLIDKYAKGTANPERMEDYRTGILSDPDSIRRWMLAYNNYLPFGWKEGPQRGRHEFSSHEIQRGKNYNYPYVWDTYFGDIPEKYFSRPPKTHTKLTGFSEERKQVLKLFQEIYPPFYYLFGKQRGKRSHLPTISRLYWGIGIPDYDTYERMREYMMKYLSRCSDSVIDAILETAEGAEWAFYQMISSWARKNHIVRPVYVVEDPVTGDVLEAAPERAQRQYKDRK